MRPTTQPSITARPSSGNNTVHSHYHAHRRADLDKRHEYCVIRSRKVACAIAPTYRSGQRRCISCRLRSSGIVEPAAKASDRERNAR